MADFKRIIQRTTNSERVETGVADLQPNEICIVEDGEELIYKDRSGNIISVSKDKYKVNTIEDLKKSKKYKVGDVIEVLGYYSPGDCGGHQRQKKPVGYNGADAVVGVDGSIWGIVHNGEINISWFGAKGDGIADDSDYFNKAATYCYRKYIILCGEKEYLVNSEIDFKQVPLNITGIFNNTVPLILGGQSQGFVDYNSKQYINRCNDVIVIGAKKQEIELTWAKNVILKAYSSRGVNQASIAYSTFVLHYTQSIKLLGDVAGDNQAWINENKFYLNDCKLFQIGNEDNSDNYIHNHNIIYGGTFEGGGESIKLYRCHSNMFYNLRLEGRTKIVFSELSKWNVIKYSFVSSDVYLTTLYPIIVGDKSTNRVVNEYCEDLKVIKEYNINQFNLQEYKDSEKTPIASILEDGRVSLGAWGYFFSDFVEANKFAKFTAFVADGRDNGDGFRCGFQTFDENFNKITGTGYKMLVEGVGIISSDESAGSNQYTHYAQSVDTYMKNTGNVKYIRFFSQASNCRGFNIGFKIETLNTCGKNDAVILESFRKPKPISTQLDTPYHATQMQKLGILNSYHNYLSELYQYEKFQNAQLDSEIMNLNILQPPKIPLEVEEYAKEYNPL